MHRTVPTIFVDLSKRVPLDRARLVPRPPHFRHLRSTVYPPACIYRTQKRPLHASLVSRALQESVSVGPGLASNLLGLNYREAAKLSTTSKLLAYRSINLWESSATELHVVIARGYGMIDLRQRGTRPRLSNL